MSDYSKMTDDDFRRILEEIVQEEGVGILSIGDVYSELSEHFNNEVLSRWEAENFEDGALSELEGEEEDKSQIPDGIYDNREERRRQKYKDGVCFHWCTRSAIHGVCRLTVDQEFYVPWGTYPDIPKEK